MPTEGLSAELDVLLRERIEDYEQLETLRLLQVDATVWWTATQLCGRLEVDEERIGAACRQLEKGQLIRSRTQGSVQSVSYAPASAQLGLLVDQLFQVYRDQPIGIVKQMSANAIERVRTAALHAFADAFVLRKDQDNG